MAEQQLVTMGLLLRTGKSFQRIVGETSEASICYSLKRVKIWNVQKKKQVNL